MYEAHFSLRTRPFSAHVRPGEALLSQEWEDSLRQAAHCLQESSDLVVLTAPSGAGKTVFCRELAQRLEIGLRPVFVPASTCSSAVGLFQSILFELDGEYHEGNESQLRQRILTGIRGLRQPQDALLLMVDDAHELEPPLLLELRNLTTHLHESRPAVRLLLSGQLALEERLASPDLTALNQRVGCHIMLGMLTRDASRQYIEHRVRNAGGRSDDIFSAEAVEFICEVCDGNLRCLNHLCDHSLLLAFVNEQPHISRAGALAALEDLKGLPLPWQLPTQPEHQSPSPAADEEMSPRPRPPLRSRWSPPESQTEPAGEAPQSTHETSHDAVAEWWNDTGDVAVIEFGGDEPDASIENARDDHPPQDDLSLQVVATAPIPAADIRMGHDAPTAMNDHTVNDQTVVETAIFDTYARLDRQAERRYAGDIVPVATSPPSVPLFLSPAAPSERDSDTIIEENLAAQIKALRDEVREAAQVKHDDVERTVEPDAELGDCAAADDDWDVVQPEFEAAEIVPLIPTPPMQVSDSDRETHAVTYPLNPPQHPSADPTMTSSEFSGDAREPKLRRYAQLFTRLQRRRREASQPPRRD